MSLEWARARLLEHREALRRLCGSESEASARALPTAPATAVVVPLKPVAAPRLAATAPVGATVIKFVRGRRA